MFMMFKNNFDWLKAVVRTHTPDSVCRMWQCLVEEFMLTDLIYTVHNLRKQDIRKFFSETDGYGCGEEQVEINRSVKRAFINVYTQVVTAFEHALHN